MSSRFRVFILWADDFVGNMINVTWGLKVEERPLGLDPSPPWHYIQLIRIGEASDFPNKGRELRFFGPLTWGSSQTHLSASVRQTGSRSCSLLKRKKGLLVFCSLILSAQLFLILLMVFHNSWIHLIRTSQVVKLSKKWQKFVESW